MFAPGVPQVSRFFTFSIGYKKPDPVIFFNIQIQKTAKFIKKTRLWRSNGLIFLRSPPLSLRFQGFLLKKRQNGLFFFEPLKKFNIKS